MTKLKAKVERLEEFSRRDNLRKYGLPHRRDSNHEDHDTCAQAVTDVPNSVAGPKRWTADDIARAHRIGQSRDGQPKPMTVKFNRWKDKMTVLSNRQFRDNVENRGTKVAIKRLDQKPSGSHRGSQEGREGGLLQERQTYGGTTTARLQDLRQSHNSRRRRSRNQTTQEQSADRVNDGGQMPREDSCRDGDSPRVNNSDGERAIPARANHGGAQSERGPRQSGLSDYWGSRRSPGNKERPTSPL